MWYDRQVMEINVIQGSLAFWCQHLVQNTPFSIWDIYLQMHLIVRKPYWKSSAAIFKEASVLSNPLLGFPCSANAASPIVPLVPGSTRVSLTLEGSRGLSGPPRRQCLGPNWLKAKSTGCWDLLGTQSHPRSGASWPASCSSCFLAPDYCHQDWGWQKEVICHCP